MINDLINQIALRFKSGNSIPIERAHITAAEWDELSAALRATGEGEWVMVPRDDVALIAEMLTWGTSEGLTERQYEDVVIHQHKLRDLIAAAPTPAEPLRDAGAALCREARELQRKHYGDGSGLHLAMIDWARKYDAAIAAHPAPAQVNEGAEKRALAAVYEWFHKNRQDAMRLLKGGDLLKVTRAALAAAAQEGK